jgi:hypothetical protein
MSGALAFCLASTGNSLAETAFFDDSGLVNFRSSFGTRKAASSSLPGMNSRPFLLPFGL